MKTLSVLSTIPAVLFFAAWANTVQFSYLRAAEITARRLTPGTERPL